MLAPTSARTSTRSSARLQGTRARFSRLMAAFAGKARAAVKPAMPVSKQASLTASPLWGRGPRAIVAAAGKGFQQTSSPEDALRQIAELDLIIDELLGGDLSARAEIIQAKWNRMDQSFFMRIASRSDASEDEALKAQLASLATEVMKVLEEIVKRTDSEMQGTAKALQAVVSSAADPQTGEFALPLSDARLGAVRTAVDLQLGGMEANDVESVLGNAYAWARKAQGDGLDGMVVIIQTIMQTWAAREVATVAGEGSALAEVCAAGSNSWPETLQRLSDEGKLTEQSISTELQRQMESTVLSLPNGSYTQRVLAEYTSTLLATTKEVLGAAK